MKVLVCGGRGYGAYERICEVLNRLHGTDKKIVLVIHGGANGADALANLWALHNNIPTLQFSADWETFGYKAGPIRNQLMIDEGKPDIVVAFPGGAGTADMVRRARAAGIVVEDNQ